ncbi:MAG: BON domain-containing protein [Anaerolineales bacterium]
MTDADIGKSELAQRIGEALQEHEELRKHPVNVSDNNGVITLTGRVEEIEIREIAEAIAEEVPGVTEVINDIEVADLGGHDPDMLDEDSPFDEEAPAHRVKSS